MTTWNESASQISRTFTFADFAEAFAFMTRVGLIAQERKHHPDMAITWNKVTVSLSTHDAGNTVTDADRALAAEIDAMSG